MFIAAAIVVTLFLGGWQVPAIVQSPRLMNLLQLATFMLKCLFLVFVSMWIRGTLPRVRIDQMMSLCWKYFVPISFINLLGTAVWVAIFPDGNRFTQWLMLSFGVAVVLLFLARVVAFTRRARMELYFHPTI
jgi:NADH-quinone oxidoreductase subunit H